MKASEHRASRVLKLLGNPVRYQIIRLLGEHEELTSSQLARQLERRQANVSQHLAKLKEQALVSSKRRGVPVWYRLNRRGILALMDELENLLVRDGQQVV